MPVIRPKKSQRRRRAFEPEKLPWYRKLGAAATRYWKVIGIGLLAVLVLFGAYVGWYMYRESRESKAATALARVNEEIAESLAEATEEITSPEELDEETIFRDAIDKYGEVADRYGDTKSGRLAKYEIANLYFELGEMEDARENFEDAGRGAGDLKILADVGIADTYAAEGENDKAAAYYEKARAASAGAFPYVYVTLKLARIREDAGDLESAKTLYREIIDYYTSSPFAEDAAEGLVRIEAKEELAGD
ncbi:MAG: tetratricopeptide repeat protein [Candidatus Coatesbacteria bacterium]|nr:MAG: tetratricopeptide repeat protein [Candidatus Coatesbacteria bacterium]